LVSCKCTPQHAILWYCVCTYFLKLHTEEGLRTKENIYDVTCLEIWESLKGYNQNLEILFPGGMWNIPGFV